jgi:hypothetical protein
LLHKYLTVRGDHELKTWDLWRELQSAEGTAKELREETSKLKAALASARNAATAAAAASEVARAHAQAEAARSVAARREAASAAAKAAAMEEVVECMAQQLAQMASARPDDAAGRHPRNGQVCASFFSFARILESSMLLFATFGSHLLLCLVPDSQWTNAWTSCRTVEEVALLLTIRAVLLQCA